jgi:hypothetical protein
LLNKYIYPNPLSKALILYIDVSVILILSLYIVILTLASGNLSNALIQGIASIIWSIIIIYLSILRNSKRERRGSKRTNSKKINHDKQRLIIIERIFGVFLLIVGIVTLPYQIISGKPLFLIFQSVWIMLIGVNHSFFGVLVTLEAYKFHGRR